MVKVAAPYPEDLPERRLTISVRDQVPKKPKKPPRPIVLPVACPPLVGFNLLPQHWIWVDWMRKSFGPNLVPSGTFDEFKTLSALEAAGWVDVSRDSPEITTKIETVPSTTDKQEADLEAHGPGDRQGPDRSRFPHARLPAGGDPLTRGQGQGRPVHPDLGRHLEADVSPRRPWRV